MSNRAKRMASHLPAPPADASLNAAMQKIVAELNRRPAQDPSATPDVFISYASQDERMAAAFAADLEARGCRTWWAVRLRGGEEFQVTICEALRTARAAAILWSPWSIRSRWVTAEAMFALDHGKIIPLLCGGLTYTALNPPFNGLHTIAHGDQAALWSALAALGIEPRHEA